MDILPAQIHPLNRPHLVVIKESEDKMYVVDPAEIRCWDGLVLVETPSHEQILCRCSPASHPCDLGKIVGSVVCVQESVKTS